MPRALRGAHDAPAELRDEFDAPTHALAFVTARRTYDAEEQGLARIDLALAWLTATLRYGLAELPDGNPRRFSREQSLTRVGRRGIVAVRGLVSTRQWLRQPAVRERDGAVALDNTNRRLPQAFQPLTLQEQHALSALKRATEVPDLLASVHALWEAIEFYTSGATVESMFSKAELKAIRDAMPTEFSAEQRAHADDRIGHFNDPSLMVRLRGLLDKEGVPITDGELELLLALRKLRNDVVHGRDSKSPPAEDVEYATSIVARMLVYRVASSRPDFGP